MPDANGPHTAQSRSLLGGFKLPIFGAGRVDRWQFDDAGNVIFYGDLTVRGTLHADFLSQEQTEIVNKWLEVGSALTNADGRAPVRITTPEAYTGNLLEIVRGGVLFARVDTNGFLDMLGGDIYGARLVELITDGTGRFDAKGGKLTNAPTLESSQGAAESAWSVPLGASDAAQHDFILKLGTTNLLRLRATGNAAGGALSGSIAWWQANHDFALGAILNARLGTDLDAEGYLLTDAGGAAFRSLAKLDWPTLRVGEWSTGAGLLQAQGASARTTYLDVLPKGSPAGTQSAIYAWNLDPTVSGQETLQEAVYLAALGTVYELGVTKSGTGTSLKPLRVRLGSTDMLTLDPAANTVNAHARAWSNLKLGTDLNAASFGIAGLSALAGDAVGPLVVSSAYAVQNAYGLILRTTDRLGALMDRFKLGTAESGASDYARGVWGSVRHEGLILGALLDANLQGIQRAAYTWLDGATPEIAWLENNADRASLWYDLAGNALELDLVNGAGAFVTAVRFIGETSAPYAQWSIPHRGFALGASMDAATYPVQNAGNISLAQHAVVQTRGAIIGRNATSITLTRDVNGKIETVTDDGATYTITRSSGKVSQVAATMGVDKPTETLVITRSPINTGKIASIARTVTGV